MKMFIIIGSLCLTTLAFAKDLKLNEYDWTVTDVARKGLNKEDLYEGMDTNKINVRSSICSNRALVWAHDFKRQYGLDTAKIFLFYTKKTAGASHKTWWYHVSPMINEGGQLWVMDAGFPGFIDQPVTRDEWFEAFVGSNRCKEIKDGDRDLVEKMVEGRVYPFNTSHGYYDCYYRITPGTYWTPATVAENILGVNAEGEAARTDRMSFNNNELYQACVEATTTRFGRIFGGGSDKCKKFR